MHNFAVVNSYVVVTMQVNVYGVVCVYENIDCREE